MPPGGGITLHFLDMTPEREALIRKVASRRQPTLTIILENVHDMHNIGAVMRSCDSVGICEIFILQTQQNLHFSQLVLGKKPLPAHENGLMSIITKMLKPASSMSGKNMIAYGVPTSPANLLLCTTWI
jgi:hypothetical protein